jgi:rhodanese-related sulfurtransferase
MLRTKTLSLSLLLVIATLVVAGCAPAPAANAPVSAALPAEISVADAAVRREAGAFVLDVRQPDEWNAVHIPGSTLIPLDQLEARLGEVPKDKEVVVVCRSGNRSKQGRDILKNAGFPQVTSMSGGLTQWSAANLPTVSGP